MAQCLDVGVQSPQRGDRFLLDTSAAVCVVYPALSMSASQQDKASRYASFLELCSRRGAEVFWSPLAFPEVAHVIERHLRLSFSPDGGVSSKEFRAIDGQRRHVVTQVSAAWQQLRQLGRCLECHLNESSVDAAFRRFEMSALDGYDMYYVNQMDTNNIPNIITDDADFASLNHIIVYTANRNALT